MLDLYSNHLTEDSIEFLTGFMREYRSIESWGFGCNKIRSFKAFDDFFNSCGRVRISSEEYQRNLALVKNRDKIIDKNAKLRTLKKPEEQVPYVDPIEQESDTGFYYQTFYKNLRYLNILGNKLRIEAENLGPLCEFLARMKETVVVLSVNDISEHAEDTLSSYSEQVLL